ncbi:hypothetical protein CB0940_05863, partial [Cercospora beticola]
QLRLWLLLEHITKHSKLLPLGPAHTVFRLQQISRHVCRLPRRREAIRRVLLQDLRHESQRPRRPLQGPVHAHIRGQPNTRRRRHHHEALRASVPASRAPSRHSRCTAQQRGRWHSGHCHWCLVGRGGEETNELLSDLPAVARWPGQLLHLQRHFPFGIPSSLNSCTRGASVNLGERAEWA